VEDLKFLSPGERVGTKKMGIFSSRLNNEGTYDPSWFTLWWATHSKTTYITQEHPSKYQGNKPILVVCTEDGKMEMKNGKIFNSGNHPIDKVSKKDDKVDLNESSTKYTKIYLNSNIFL